MTKIAELLHKHEGYRQFAYKDTVGKLTIGIGFNLDDVGLSLAESYLILNHRIEQLEIELERVFPWYHELDEVRQAVIIDMAYNLGVPKLKTFVTTLGFVKDGEYQQAARQMLGTLWAKQVKGRAKTLARMMQSGEWPE